MRFMMLLAAVAGSGVAPAIAADQPLDAAQVSSAPRAGAPIAAPAPAAQPAIKLRSSPVDSAPAAPVVGKAPDTAVVAPETKPPVAADAAAKPSAPPPPTVVVKINLSTQQMDVSVDGTPKYSWPVSSGRSGYPTPRGTWKAQWTSRMWYSRKYDNAPMPHAVFFTGGVAIHATYATAMLGRPASHGCVRLSPANAKTFFDLVQTRGLSQTQITVYGSPSAGPARVADRRERGERADRSERPSRRGAAQHVASTRNGVVYLRPGSPYAGRDSFVMNGVRYVRVR